MGKLCHTWEIRPRTVVMCVAVLGWAVTHWLWKDTPPFIDQILVMGFGAWFGAEIIEPDDPWRGPWDDEH